MCAVRQAVCYVVRLLIITMLFIAMVPERGFAVEVWPEFRGPLGNGVAEGSNPPLRWNESEKITWKTSVHGQGWSSPVVWDNQVWLTTATEDGKRMSVVCIDRQTGKTIRDILAFENDSPRFKHATNSYASPTPAIEAGRIYVHFGSYGTACFDTETGERLWERRDLPCNHWRGPGSSPILHEGRLFVAYDGYDLQYMVALDTETGATIWQRNRDIDYGSEDGDHKKAYGTCQIIEHEGRWQLISPSAAATIAYDPATGAELWRVQHGGMNAATRPVYGEGLVFLTVGDAVGNRPPALLAVRPEGSGEITATAIAWKLDRRPPKRPSPLYFDGLLFTISDDGVATCLEASNGEEVWRERIGGNFRASPVCAAGRIYFCSLEGDVTVIAAAREFRELARNEMADGFQASPAIVGDSLFLRSTANLYRIDDTTTLK